MTTLFLLIRPRATAVCTRQHSRCGQRANLTSEMLTSLHHGLVELAPEPQRLDALTSTVFGTLLLVDAPAESGTA